MSWFKYRVQQVKLSTFIIRIFDFEELELDSEKWPNIRPKLDFTGYLVHP